MLSVKDDKGYSQGYKDSAAMQIRTKRRVDYFLNLMDKSEIKDVLEIGCGRGEVSNYIAENSNHQVLGTDICRPFIDEANKRYQLPNLNFAVLDFNNPVEVEKKQFDYIIGNGILHHLYYNIDESLINLRKLLKPGGKIIFLEPNLLNPYCYLIFATIPLFRNMAKLEPTEKAFSKSFITKNLIKHEFSDIDVKYKDFLLPIIPKFMIGFVISVGNVVEKIPGLRVLTQSIFISASKPK